MDTIKKSVRAYVLALILFALMSFLLAAIICFTGFPEDMSFAGMIIVLSAVSAFIGAGEGKIVGKRGIIVGFIAAAVFVFLILLAAGCVFAGGLEKASLSTFYLIPPAAGAVGGALGVNIGK